MERRNRLSDKKIIDTLRECNGLISVAARRLGTARTTIHRRVEKSKAVADALADCRSYLGDIAESQLIKAITEGKPWAIALYLKTQCKDRGYVERHDVAAEIAHSGSVGIRILEDDDWFGRPARLDAEAAAPSNPSSNGHGKI